ncbi:SH3 domain-containing kinase-binding protein 1 isoform X2 [Sitodiplosis mosellana]|uniref:SH3 domain-containing kinase-binding protein 1 isoform X2 n=1 Tax=Sitodiplosis mosellana TaxID=263140 RepID=UPI002444836D|nr:SH3 domain-containing kinase-binding protein 1 isoform X2 [Sitodiplosis mosellana]
MKIKDTMDSSATRNGVSAIVEYNYTAKESDEITLVKGAIINNIKRQSGGWWEGTLASTGKTGMFPDNFVRVLESDDKSPVVLRDKSETKNRRCKAVYSYTQNNNDELTLAVGDIVEFLGEVEEGWWRGKLSGKIGVFPSNFVEVYQSASPVFAKRISNNNGTANNNNSRSGASLNSSREDLVSSNTSTSSEKDAPSLPPKPVREVCRVIFSYKPVNEDELELKEGEIITVLSKELPDKGWWKGELKGKVGVFPDNFVQLIVNDGSPQKDHSNHTPERPPSTTKLLINNNTNSNSKKMEGLGSRDSLNDTGIMAGNVAAYRKSLENKCNEPQQVTTRRTLIETKSTAEIRKSLENLDDRKSTPPPLTKKPVVPIKKSPTVGSVAGNIFSGLKQKVKSVEQKITHHDSLDGVGSSKAVSHVADNSEKGISGERLHRDDTEFDQVERNSSILPDMRAQRAKAPKRRLPSSNSTNLSESLSYQNGGGGGDSPTPASPILTNDSSINKSEEDLTKPAKQRGWEKNKAPWMDELKASQAKKTSPGSIEMRSPENNSSHSNNNDSNSSDHKTTSNSNSFNSSHKKEINTFEVRSSSVDIKTSSDSTFHSNSMRKEPVDSSMAKSLSSLATKISISDSSTAAATTTTTATAAAVSDENATNNGIKGRPTSVTLRNVNLPPVGRLTKTIHDNGGIVQTSTATITSKTATIIQDDVTNHSGPTVTTVTTDNVCSRVAELELRVSQLEKLAQRQNHTIEQLLKSLKDESDKHHRPSTPKAYNRYK